MLAGLEGIFTKVDNITPALEAVELQRPVFFGRRPRWVLGLSETEHA
jgi:hypothetical protein